LTKLAQADGLAAGRRMRVDTTVVETNIHYPTDSSLLGDGVRVLIRTMKGIGKIVGDAGTKLCDRSRSVKLRVLDIARAARSRAKQGRERLKSAYGTLLNATSRVVGQAKQFSEEIASGTKRAKDVLKQLALEGLRQKLDVMVPLVKQVMKQTRARIFRGDTRAEGKILSLFEPSTEIIRKGKAAKPNEFGKMVKLQEAEDQIVIDYQVYDRRPSDSDLLIAVAFCNGNRATVGPTSSTSGRDWTNSSARVAMRVTLVRQVWEGMPNPSTRRVAQKFRQAGRPLSHETVRRWRANGWRPLDREQHPLCANRRSSRMST